MPVRPHERPQMPGFRAILPGSVLCALLILTAACGRDAAPIYEGREDAYFYPAPETVVAPSTTIAGEAPQP